MLAAVALKKLGWWVRWLYGKGPCLARLSLLLEAMQRCPERDESDLRVLTVTHATSLPTVHKHTQ